jgi:ubiquinol-cytochrome c reductase cytochrome c subunit
MAIRRTLSLVVVALGLSSTSAHAQSAPVGDAARGQRIYASHGCYQCHGTVGQGSNAGSRLAPDPLPFQAFSILVRQPRARMPPYSARLLSEQDLADIHAYLLTIPKARTVAEIPLLSAPP